MPNSEKTVFTFVNPVTFYRSAMDVLRLWFMMLWFFVMQSNVVHKYRLTEQLWTP